MLSKGGTTGCPPRSTVTRYSVLMYEFPYNVNFGWAKGGKKERPGVGVSASPVWGKLALEMLNWGPERTDERGGFSGGRFCHSYPAALRRRGHSLIWCRY